MHLPAPRRNAMKRSSWAQSAALALAAAVTVACATEPEVATAPSYPPPPAEGYPPQAYPAQPYRETHVAYPPSQIAPTVVAGDTVQPGTRLFGRLRQPVGAG